MTQSHFNNPANADDGIYAINTWSEYVLESPNKDGRTSSVGCGYHDNIACEIEQAVFTSIYLHTDRSR